MHDAQQAKQNRVHHADDPEDHSKWAHCLLMDSALDGQIHAVFKPFHNLIKPLLELIDSGFKPPDHLVKIVLG